MGESLTNQSLLSNLHSLVLAHNNDLTGTIPPQISMLRNLSHLALSGARLTGTFPPQILMLKKLTGLWLYKTNVNGTLPPQTSM